MSTFHLADKLESALQAVISPAVAALAEPANVYTGKQRVDKITPAVICMVTGEGEEEPVFTGNFWLSASVEIEHLAVDGSGAGETRDQMELLNDAVAGAVFSDTLEASLSAAVPDFHVYKSGIIRGTPTTEVHEHDIWVDIFPLRVYCIARASS